MTQTSTNRRNKQNEISNEKKKIMNDQTANMDKYHMNIYNNNNYKHKTYKHSKLKLICTKSVNLLNSMRFRNRIACMCHSGKEQKPLF